MKEFGNGSMGTYDGGAVWNFISYPASKGNFVATTQGVNSWLSPVSMSKELVYT